MTEIPIFEENKIKRDRYEETNLGGSLIAPVKYACMGTTSES